MLHALLRTLEIVGAVLEWSVILTLGFTLVAKSIRDALAAIRRFPS